MIIVIISSIKGLRMKKILKISLIASVALSSLYAADINSVKDMFTNGSTSGQVRLGYINVNSADDNYATALGGQLKFETAALSGVSLGAAMYTSQSVNSLSGSGDEFNSELTSTNGNYTELAEAYINYGMGDFNFRIGRQLIDTPLADSDDIRMTPHTFEAAVASYTLKDLGVTFIGANLQRWQGVDADYENVTNNSWADTGVDGTWIGAATYRDDSIEAALWYYNITETLNAIYSDVVGSIEVGEMSITLGAQYLSESEIDSSGVDGSIMGVMAEATVADVTLMAAYNNLSVDAGKEIFEGFGGGSSFTNMDTNTAGLFGDEDSASMLFSLGYEIIGANIIAAYGDFKADDSDNHATEIDLGVEYSYNDGEADVALYYIIGSDEGNTNPELDDDHIQLTLNYNF